MATTPIVILPLGSWEQHGEHLPPDTDSVIINEVVRRAVSDLSGCVIAPTVTITASDEHAGFTNTLSIGTQPLIDSVVAIARSASWARGVCIVNGHGGNSDALHAIGSALEFEKITHSIWSLPSYKGADMHAGHTETSVMLHIAPERVDMSRAVAGNSGNPADIISSMRSGGMKSVSPNGILGDPTHATPEHGAEVMALYVNNLQSMLHSCLKQWTTL